VVPSAIFEWEAMKIMNNEPKAPAILGPPAQMGMPMGLTPQVLYMNGFKAGYSTTDVFIVLQQNGNDIAVLNILTRLQKHLASPCKR